MPESCYESNGEPGFGPEWVHEQRSDGSCQCGYYGALPTVRCHRRMEHAQHIDRVNGRRFLCDGV